MESFVSMICSVCENPTFICKCDKSWNYLNKCNGAITTEVSYTPLNVSTITVCFMFNSEINLQVVKEGLPKGMDVKFKPGSKKSKIKAATEADGLIQNKVSDNRASPTFQQAPLLEIRGGTEKEN